MASIKSEAPSDTRFVFHAPNALSLPLQIVRIKIAFRADHCNSWKAAHFHSYFSYHTFLQTYSMVEQTQILWQCIYNCVSLEQLSNIKSNSTISSIQFFLFYQDFNKRVESDDTMILEKSSSPVYSHDQLPKVSWYYHKNVLTFISFIQTR